MVDLKEYHLVLCTSLTLDAYHEGRGEIFYTGNSRKTKKRPPYVANQKVGLATYYAITMHFMETSMNQC